MTDDTLGADEVIPDARLGAAVLRNLLLGKGNECSNQLGTD